MHLSEFPFIIRCYTIILMYSALVRLTCHEMKQSDQQLRELPALTIIVPALYGSIEEGYQQPHINITLLG